MSRSGGRSDGGLSIREQQAAPTGGLAESMARPQASADLAALATGTLFMVGLALPAGVTITNLIFTAGATPGAAMSNQWAALFSPARAKLAISADATNAAWSANTSKTFLMTAPYLVPTAGLYYAGLLVVGTVPTLRGAVAPGNSVIYANPPILCGTSTASLTNPASCPDPAASIGVTVNLPYVYAT